MSLEERVRERLIQIIIRHRPSQYEAMVDAILREFALRPVAQGKVGEDGLVTTDC